MRLIPWSVLLGNFANLLLICDFIFAEESESICLSWVFDVGRVKEILNAEADLGTMAVSKSVY